MSEELGRISKPLAEQYKQGRRLFLLPLLITPPSPPEDLAAITARYWKDADNQISSLELKIGSVNRIYHEMVSTEGGNGLKTIESISKESSRLVNAITQRGALLMPTEDEDVLSEYMDWGRCLSAGLFNHKVFSTVLNNYQQAHNRRNQIISQRIGEGLKENEIGLLLISENHNVQFPQDVEVFYIAPPALDEFKRWLRQKQVTDTETEQTSSDDQIRNEPQLQSQGHPKKTRAQAMPEEGKGSKNKLRALQSN